MVEISLAQAKARLSELVELVCSGEQVSITRRGKPVAVLGPALRTFVPIDVERLRAVTDGMTRQKKGARTFIRKMRDDARY